jgi:hypothetical protein
LISTPWPCAGSGQHRSGPMDVAEEVGLQHPPERLGRGRLQRAEQVDTGVVDPDVDAAEPRPPSGPVRPWPTHRSRRWARSTPGRRPPRIPVPVPPARRRVGRPAPRAPCLANSSPVARPIPLEAPVTTTPPVRFLPIPITRLLVTTPTGLPRTDRANRLPGAGAARPAAPRRPSRQTRRRKGGCLMPRPAPDADPAACAARCRRTG